MMKNYEYDVFLSYKQDDVYGRWVIEHFLAFFRNVLESLLDRKARVFFDRNGISPGDSWPEKLKQALGQSRCLVGVWSPGYFSSEWCRYECAAMLYREEQLGLRTINRPYGLIVPIKVQDGKRFPERVQGIQAKNFRDCVWDGPQQIGYELCLNMQGKIRKFAKEVANTVDDAPPWQQDWLSPEWLDEPCQRIDLTLQPRNRRPGRESSNG